MNKEQQAGLGGGELGTFPAGTGRDRVPAPGWVPTASPCPFHSPARPPAWGSFLSLLPLCSCLLRRPGRRAPGKDLPVALWPRGLIQFPRESHPRTWQSPGGGLLLSGRLNPRCRTCEKKWC